MAVSTVQVAGTGWLALSKRDARGAQTLGPIKSGSVFALK